MSDTVIAVVGAVLVLAFIVWATLPRRASRRAITREAPPDWWSARLDEVLPFFAELAEADRARFLDEVAVFLADQHIEAVRCEPDEVDLLFVAGTAVMMAWGLEGFRYPSYRDILIYPEAFDDEYNPRDDGERLGELLAGGPMILSLPWLREAQSYDDAVDVAVHELAHVFDSLAGDGQHFGSELDERVDAFLADEALVAEIEADRSPLDPYALENEAEFFAVASEVFFHDPPALAEAHPAIYAWLVEVYRQDPGRPGTRLG